MIAAVALADALRVVVRLARPNTPKRDRERFVRELLRRLGEDDPRRDRFLRDAAHHCRGDEDALRRLTAARQIIRQHTTREGN